MPAAPTRPRPDSDALDRVLGNLSTQHGCDLAVSAPDATGSVIITAPDVAKRWRYSAEGRLAVDRQTTRS